MRSPLEAIANRLPVFACCCSLLIARHQQYEGVNEMAANGTLAPVTGLVPEVLEGGLTAEEIEDVNGFNTITFEGGGLRVQIRENGWVALEYDRGRLRWRHVV